MTKVDAHDNISSPNLDLMERRFIKCTLRLHELKAVDNITTSVSFRNTNQIAAFSLTFNTTADIGMITLVGPANTSEFMLTNSTQVEETLFVESEAIDGNLIPQSTSFTSILEVSYDEIISTWFTMF